MVTCRKCMLACSSKHMHTAACAAAGVPAATAGKLKANEWVNAALEVLGGKGGGKPVLAQGQGPEVAKAPDAMAAAEQFAALKL